MEIIEHIKTIILRISMIINVLISFSVIILAIFGVIMIYSASSIWAEYKFGNEYKFLISQSIFLIVGIATMKVVSNIDYHIYYKYLKINLLNTMFLAL